MIRINLSPDAKRRTPGRGPSVQQIVPSTDVSKGAIIAVVMIVGWVGVGVVAYFVQQSIIEDTKVLTAKAKQLDQQAADINAQIDEEGLQARFNRYEELKAAKEALEKKRRSPVYVYHELANVLTTGKHPDVDEAEQRQRVAIDPQARLDLDWDAQSVWLLSMAEKENDVLDITGGARDPDDLSEFVKRLRASARFARVSHPEFQLKEVKEDAATKELKPGDAIQNFYTFELTAQVRYWD
ncbi:PilN domain-containing protein [Pseudenhygromyxa sp. WMMC2535]|uniref:PilN domain-containing protein n=1 Tax=Pseudenhygromyxa sp. WMMC2535 TaxID=2712867 RepID=UPI001556D3CB|nr:PilN domain-containing protein [Pseudenhygromyxa sp. WMMC2535]NVB38279.1 PilN domain-containing protein [Pseudenhygromyxa sp. WMMC2535]